MEFYVKVAIFSILKWNFQNINTVIAGLYRSDLREVCQCSIATNMKSHGLGVNESKHE